VLTRPANYDPKFGKNVAVANLSLLNTNWYVKQLKDWGAPISFSATERVDGKPIIDELPQGFMGKNRRTFLLKDVMIRDIIATNAGIKLRWPEDYASTSEEFMTKVMDKYQEGEMSVFFATTVDRGENLKDVEPYLRLEGLANRVTNVKNLGQVDVSRTQYLLNNYKMVSMLDPKVSKDENTRGLFMNYIASYAALSQEYQKAGQLDLAISTLSQTLNFDIDQQRKVPIYYNLSMFSLMKQDFNNALVYLDSVEKMGYKDPDLIIRRGWIYQQQGNYQAAEQVFEQARIQNPNKPEPIQSLVNLYTDYMHDTTKAKTVLQDWLRRNPNDATAKQMLQGLEKK
jgi:tetratricopeptide (TPR) repeat protein